MSLRDEVAAVTKTGGRRSLLDDICDQLKPKEAAELRDLVADRVNVSGGAIGRALRARGFTVSDQTIYKWRSR